MSRRPQSANPASGEIRLPTGSFTGTSPATQLGFWVELEAYYGASQNLRQEGVAVNLSPSGGTTIVAISPWWEEVGPSSVGCPAHFGSQSAKLGDVLGIGVSTTGGVSSGRSSMVRKSSFWFRRTWFRPTDSPGSTVGHNPTKSSRGRGRYHALSPARSRRVEGDRLPDGNGSDFPSAAVYPDLAIA